MKKRFDIRTIAVAVAATIVVFSGLVSCKGRTMKNMEPTGDTVEVIIDRAADDADFPVMPNDSI